jgi:hypothetical protein
VAAKKRASHVARQKKYKGRESRFTRRSKEVVPRPDLAYEDDARKAALSEAEVALRELQKESRLSAAASRESREAAELDYQRRLVLARRLVDERRLELAKFRREMTGIPAPREYYGRSAKPAPPADAAPGATGYRPPQEPSWRSGNPGVARLRKLNGLD